MRESEAAVARRENLVLRKETMVRGSHKEVTQEELRRSSETLQRKIHKTLKNQCYLIALQNRNKKLREVCAGSYKLSSSSETVVASLQSQRERLADYSNILKHRCEDLPQHQGVLHHVTQAIEAYIKMSQQ
ncbi:hypothetical protein GOODEAATRI_009561 [Goodea atripinnis]|uniref:Uncharacterized protein n=1 Tax=Goodea atripinnis TaxID=208336 RepID=A0ABV0P2S5_9TELE